MKARAAARRIARALAVAWLAALVGCLAWGRRQFAVAIPPNLGNHERNLASLPPPGAPVEFAVVSDPHASAVFARLAAEIARGRPDFVILLGDFVRGPDLARNRFFWDEIRRTGIDCPIFIVLGDNDVTPRRGAVEPEVTLAQYAAWYGPRNFSFRAGDCLFLLLFNVRGVHGGEYLAFLGKALERRPSEARHVFVCAHVPPWFSLPGAPEGYLENDPAFFDLLERHRVGYALSGHEHGQWRGRHRGTDFIRLAGGGGRLPEPEGWGMFHHAARFRIDGDLVAEELLVVPRTRAPLKALRHACWVHAYPFWRRHPLLLAAAVAAPALLLILLMRKRP
ncbi:MAG: metallophosphoesterase [bacterium]|nr:metallophosphoesterase [bacterium]